MEYIIGIILLISFFGLAYYCIKGHNLMIGFLLFPTGGEFVRFCIMDPEDNQRLLTVFQKISQSARKQV